MIHRQMWNNREPSEAPEAEAKEPATFQHSLQQPNDKNIEIYIRMENILFSQK